MREEDKPSQKKREEEKFVSLLEFLVCSESPVSVFRAGDRTCSRTGCERIKDTGNDREKQTWKVKKEEKEEIPVRDFSSPFFDPNLGK